MALVDPEGIACKLVGASTTTISVGMERPKNLCGSLGSTGTLLVDKPSPPNTFVAMGVQIEPGARLVDVSRTLLVFELPCQMKFRFEPDLTMLPGTITGDG